MFRRKCFCVTAVLITVLLLAGLLPETVTAEDSGVFHYHLEPVYRPLGDYEVENFSSFSGNSEGLLRIRDNTGKSAYLVTESKQYRKQLF